MGLSFSPAGGGGGFRLGPEQNTFASNTARDTFFSANPNILAQYDADQFNVILVGAGSSAEYQQRLNGAWQAATGVLTGPAGLDGDAASLENVTIGHVPYKDSNNTFGDSGAQILSDGTLLAPADFGVEGATIRFGDLMEMSENNSLISLLNLQFPNTTFRLIDARNRRTTASERPRQLAATATERFFELQPNFSTPLTGNTLTFGYTVVLPGTDPTRGLQTNDLRLKASAEMTNVRVRVRYGDAPNTPIKYIPSKAAWESGTGGTTWTPNGSNDIPPIDLGNSDFITFNGDQIEVEIRADNMTLLGDTNVLGNAQFPYLAGMVQDTVFIDLAYLRDLLIDSSGFDGNLDSSVTTIQALAQAVDDLIFTDDQTAAEVSVDATGFDGNLDSSVDDVQALAQAVDDLNITGSFSYTDGAGTNNELVSKTGTDGEAKGTGIVLTGEGRIPSDRVGRSPLVLSGSGGSITINAANIATYLDRTVVIDHSTTFTVNVASIASLHAALDGHYLEFENARSNVVGIQGISGQTIGGMRQIRLNNVGESVRFTVPEESNETNFVVLQEFARSVSSRVMLDYDLLTGGLIGEDRNHSVVRMLPASGVTQNYNIQDGMPDGTNFILQNFGQGQAVIGTEASETLEGQATYTLAAFNAIWITKSGTDYKIVPMEDISHETRITQLQNDVDSLETFNDRDQLRIQYSSLALGFDSSPARETEDLICFVCSWTGTKAVRINLQGNVINLGTFAAGSHSVNFTVSATQWDNIYSNLVGTSADGQGELRIEADLVQLDQINFRGDNGSVREQTEELYDRFFRGVDVLANGIENGIAGNPNANRSYALTMNTYLDGSSNIRVLLNGITVHQFTGITNGNHTLKYDISASEWGNIFAGFTGDIMNFRLTRGSTVLYSRNFRVDVT